jgi:dihydrofolate reductase
MDVGEEVEYRLHPGARSEMRPSPHSTNLVGGPSTIQAFRETDALHELTLALVPIIQGSGVPLAPAGSRPLSLTLQSTRQYPDGVIEASFLPSEDPQ